MIKQLWVQSLVCVFAASPVWAAAVAVFPEKTFDAGEIQVGQTFEHDFIVRNEGDTKFKITDVRPSCHCTVPDYPPEVLPGQSAKIKVKINTEGLHAEKLTKNVTVATDAPGGERTVLAINFNLTTPLEFVPNAQVYLYSRLGEAKEAQVLARPHRSGMKITAARSTNPNLTVTLEAVKNAEAKPAAGLGLQLLPRDGDVWLTIKLAPTMPAGTFAAEIAVRTSDPSYPEGTIKVRGKIEGAPAPPAASH